MPERLFVSDLQDDYEERYFEYYGIEYQLYQEDCDVTEHAKSGLVG